MKNSVSVNVKLDVQDLRKHLIEERYDNIPNKIGFYGWWIIIGVLGMLFLISCLWALIAFDNIIFIDGLLFLGFALFLYFGSSNPIKLAIYANKTMKSDKLMQKEICIILDDSGMSTSFDTSNINIEWKDIFCAKEFKSGFAIYLNKTSGQVIPKRFLTADDIYLIREILTKNIESRKLTLKKTNK
ncbi:YcxB family protein [Acetivibrio cellulolyticus]|uniref:YcxB family protein n=1 Tax=Acetivibrio cellulolyticus TaxID=35830 RepID=UPI0001E2E6C5|nr:YcxB family protein [Acetivibrio cellulolyticus]